MRSLTSSLRNIRYHRISYLVIGRQIPPRSPIARLLLIKLSIFTIQRLIAVDTAFSCNLSDKIPNRPADIPETFAPRHSSSCFLTN